MVVALGFVLLFIELFAGGLHAQAAVALSHLVERACDRHPEGTAEQQAEQNSEHWAEPLGALGPGVKPGGFVAKLFHGIRGEGPRRGQVDQTRERSSAWIISTIAVLRAAISGFLERAACMEISAELSIRIRVEMVLQRSGVQKFIGVVVN